MERPDGLRIDPHPAADHTTLGFSGVIDGATYRHARDAIVKAALDGPPALVIDVTEVDVPAPSAWAVFTSARWLTSRWPDVPMGLVCRKAEGREVLQRNGISRYVPVFADVAAAVEALADAGAAARRRVRDQWPATPATLPAVREFVAHWLREWGADDLIPTASVVATALVDNVLRHTDSSPDVRVESAGATVTVAVSDGSTAQAVIREDDEVTGALSDLMIVDALTVAWGNTPTDTGKTVWAVMGPQNRL